jgi:nickel/cobalt exporter
MEKLFVVQEWIREILVAQFSSYAAAPNVSLLIWLIPLGILFGAIHSLTPGHSKMVLASYVLGSRLSIIRSLAVSSSLAFVHVTSAVVLALTTAALVKATLGGAGRAPMLEFVSGSLLAILGLWLLWRGFRHQSHVHNEGIAVGIAAGLIPCPLTLFTMFLAQSRGVPEIGVAFAAMMMFGVMLTLSLVAIGTVFARDRLLIFMEKHGAAGTRALRVFDIATGVLLVTAGIVRAGALV